MTEEREDPRVDAVAGPDRPGHSGTGEGGPGRGGPGHGGPGHDGNEPAGGGPGSRLGRPRWGLALVLLVAIGVRLAGLGWGLPHLDLHPDEPLLMDRADRVDWADPNPGFFIYPSFFIYQEALVLGAVGAAGAGPAWGLYASRGLSALWSIVALLALYGLGRRLGGRRLGLLAAGLYAVHGASVLHAHYAVTDTPMTALATVTLWLAVRAWQERSPSGVLLAAAAAGLAVSTKYSAASVVYVPLVAAFALAARERWSPARSALLALAVPATALVAFLATSPYVVLDHRTFLADLQVEAELQATARAGWHVDPLTGVGWHDLGLVENLGALLRDVGPFGLLLAALALGTVLVAFFRRRFVEPDSSWSAPESADQASGAGSADEGSGPASGDTRSRWGPAPGQPGAWKRHLADPVPSGPTLTGWAIVAVWPVLFYLQMAPSAIGGTRYMLPVYPALLLFAAEGIRQATLWRGRGIRNAGLAAFLTLLVAAPPLWETGRIVSLLSRRDTRLVARDWVLENVPPGAVVAREHYAPPLHSGDGYRVLRPFSLTDQSLGAYCAREVEYLLLSSANAARYLEDETDRFADERDWYRRLKERTRLVRRFEGAGYGIHHPTIEVRRLFCP